MDTDDEPGDGHVVTVGAVRSGSGVRGTVREEHGESNHEWGSHGPLRVLDLTGDLGRYATKVLVELGADVVRLTTEGDRGHPMRDPAADRLGGVLDWWCDGGKRAVPLDLDCSADRDTYRALVRRADLIVETTAPGWLAERELDHQHLCRAHPALVQVSLTPFGRTGPRAGWLASDLVLGALGGVLSVTGTPDRPLNVWGRQSCNLAGLHAALCGLAGVLAARRTGRGAHVDVSAQQVVVSCLEHVLVQWDFHDVSTRPRVATRQGSRHWRGALEVVPCRRGHALVSAAPWADDLLTWLDAEGVAGALELRGDVTRARIDDVMALLRDVARTRDADELWRESQRRGTAAAEVLDVARAAAVPQLEHRRAFGAVRVAPGVEVTMPARLIHRPHRPARPAAPPSGPTAPAAVVAGWRPRPGTAGDGADGGPPLAGVRVADFSWVMAGPHATRLLGDLGADVVRVQTAARAVTINDPAEPFYAVWNRSKRSASLDMAHPRALEMARRLIERSDVLIENFSAGVMSRWGLDWETLRGWNPRLVYVTMSGCGHDGPWRDLIAFAPTIHAWCGLTYLTNPPGAGDVGPGVSTSDHAAGVAAAVAVVAALAERDETGLGQLVDLAQLDVGVHLAGPAFVDLLTNGRAAAPAGNVDGLHPHVPDEVYATADGHLAVTCLDDGQFSRLVEVVGDDRLRLPELQREDGRVAARDLVDGVVAAWAATRRGRDAMEELQAAGVPAGVVQDAADLAEHDPQLRARAAWQRLRHQHFGERLIDRFPAWWDGRPVDTRRAAPAYVGADDLEVWAEVADLTPAEVAEAMAEGPFR